MISRQYRFNKFRYETILSFQDQYSRLKNIENIEYQMNKYIFRKQIYIGVLSNTIDALSRKKLQSNARRISDCDSSISYGLKTNCKSGLTLCLWYYARINFPSLSSVREKTNTQIMFPPFRIR